jgi:SAM-dependent methyltransferase
MQSNLPERLNHPDTTANRKAFIANKPFMHQIYVEWYQLIKQHLPDLNGVMVELGSGPGFLDEEVPGVITSDLLFLPYLDALMNGRYLPFMQNGVDSIMMVDVFHHISDAVAFFDEVNRVLKIGGRLIMIEPWMTPWSRWIYTRFHHEPVDMDVIDWKFKPSGPLTGANQALPWVVFKRDRERFEQRFPGLQITKIQPIMPITYLLGGGFAMRTSLPGFSYGVMRKLESRLIKPEKAGMFALIVVEKVK